MIRRLAATAALAVLMVAGAPAAAGATESCVEIEGVRACIPLDECIVILGMKACPMALIPPPE